MRRRLDLAATLVAAPPVLFLDEPTTGLDPQSRNDLWELLRELVRDGATLLLTTQYLEEADRLADDIVVLDHGRVVASGTPAELKARIGGERIDVTVAAADDLPARRGRARALRRRPAVDDPERAVLTVPVRAGTPFIEVVRALDAAGVAATDVHRREATLDDVFLTLTDRTPTRRCACPMPPPSPRCAPAGSSPTPSRSPRRNLEHVRQIPEKLLDVTLQPIMFVLLFAFVFGGVIAVPGGDYRDYLIGGILVQTARLRDDGPGRLDRHRPRRGHGRPHPLAADLAVGVPARPLRRRAGGHAARASSILAATGFASAGASTASVAEAIGGFALLVALRGAMIWLGTLIGVIVRSPDAVQGFAFMVVFPLTFLSNAFVPAEGLPNGLQQIAEWNPVSAVVAARAHAVRQPDRAPRRRAVAARSTRCSPPCCGRWRSWPWRRRCAWRGSSAGRRASPGSA